MYSVVGGGLVDEDEGAANVGKNTNITISGGAWAGDTEVSSSQPDKIAVAGGGHILSNDPSMIGTNSDIKTATTNVGGEVHITLNGITGNLVDLYCRRMLRRGQVERREDYGHDGASQD